VEEWDAIHHKPTVLEREIYSLANVYRTLPDGRLAPSAEGFLACLADGLRPAAWAWLRDRWALAFSDAPRRALGATALWSDAAMDAQQPDFIANRTWTVHRWLFHLMYHGAPVQTAVRVSDLAGVSGALLVLNPQLLPPPEREAVQAYRGGPVVLIGHGGCEVRGGAAFTDEESEPLPGDPLDIMEPNGFWDHLEFRPVSETFLQACAETIIRASGAPRAEADGDAVCLMSTETATGAIRVAIKNKTPFYARPTIALPRPAAALTVLTPFPSVIEATETDRFTVRVPPDGLTVVEAAPTPA